MKKTNPTILFLSLVFLIFFMADVAVPCTSILVTKGASRDKSVHITYSCDGEFLPRLRIYPAADHKADEKIETFGEDGQRHEIPQVPHTYKVVGSMNEFQLAIGETTFDGRPELVNPDGWLHYWQLMALTLQRAKTAREAIAVLTGLAERYGYNSSGESFSIADQDEAWILEMVGPGKGGKGAYWVALRIPDGMVSAHANMSRIGEFPLDDPQNCLYAKDMIEFATQKGYYDPKSGPFNFSLAFNPPTEEQVKYSARRVWSIFRRVAPSLNLSPDFSSSRNNARPYPLWIRPDKPLSTRDIIALHRDHYEGTVFDMTQDLSAGPFGSPDRRRPMKWRVADRTYSWERPISTPQVGFVFVSQSRSFVPDAIGGVLWYGLDNPYTNFFIPLYTSITELPKAYTQGSLKAFSRDSAWWTFNFVANYANLRYDRMIQDIQKVQEEIENLQFDLQPAIEQTALNLQANRPDLIPAFLTRYCVTNAQMNLERWWELAELLITRYNDGYIQNDKGNPEEVGYSEKWLKEELKKNPTKFLLKKERKGKGEL